MNYMNILSMEFRNNIYIYIPIVLEYEMKPFSTICLSPCLQGIIYIYVFNYQSVYSKYIINIIYYCTI